ncbi:hypothetical protein [Streptomyces anandii]|uniref:hypothetical protein n=1 Tax=Streptomyces anandii TaxID=285454 RepID=UPI00378C6240
MTQQRHNWAVRIITETLVGLVPGAAETDTKVIVERPHIAPCGGRDTWSGSPSGVAERIAAALYGVGGQSPLEAAEAAKRARDLGGEVAALMAAEAALKAAPWYPSRAGDLVHVHYDATTAGSDAFGETYVVEADDAHPGELQLRLLHHTAKDDTLAGCFAPAETPDEPLYQLWFEAGAHLLTIVRNGRVVHDGRYA